MSHWWSNEEIPQGGVVAYLHTLHMEGGQKSHRLSFDFESVFGVPGRDHSEEYPVTVEALYRDANPTKE